MNVSGLGFRDDQKFDASFVEGKMHMGKSGEQNEFKALIGEADDGNPPRKCQVKDCANMVPFAEMAGCRTAVCRECRDELHRILSEMSRGGDGRQEYFSA